MRQFNGVLITLTALLCLLAASETFAQPLAPRSGEVVNLDAFFIKFVSKLPGFGGYFFDSDGDLNVYLTDLSREPETRVLLADAAAQRPERWSQPWTRRAQIIVRHGQFDFAELDAIRGRLITQIGNMAGIQMFDTDERANNVFVGVADEQTRQRVLARLAALNLPQNSVQVDITDIRPLTSLSNSVRPTVGGLDIEYTTSDNVTHDCTLGVNVLYGNAAAGIPTGTPGFYTASHCSQTEGQTEGTVYSQGVGGSRVGYEAYEHPFYTYATDPTNCPYPFTNYGCRWSDVTFVAYDSGVSRKQGYLAQTTSKGVGLGQAGSTTLAILGTWQFAATSTVLPVAGMTLDKVGEATGWTEGSVRRTCFEAATDCTNCGSTINKVYVRCSTEVDADGTYGDSGAPVFQLLGQNNNVAFSGIVWGADFNRGSFYYSPVDQIQKDMGTDVQYVP